MYNLKRTLEQVIDIRYGFWHSYSWPIVAPNSPHQTREGRGQRAGSAFREKHSSIVAEAKLGVRLSVEN